MVLVGPPLVMFQDLVLDVTRVTAEADADGCVNTMQPAVAPRDWLLLGRWEVTTKSYAYRRGDVVVLAYVIRLWFKRRADRVEVCNRSPVHPNEYIVRRITAIEGDLVKMDRHPDALRPPGLMRVPMGHCWVRTDQDVSGATDSGIFGPVCYLHNEFNDSIGRFPRSRSV